MKMGKNKIDLVNLLAKYQTGGNAYTQQNFGQSRRQMEVQQSFYGRRTFQPQNNSSSNYKIVQHQPQIDYRAQTSTTSYVGTFKMSKQQCQNFLLEIQSQLNKQKKKLSDVTHSTLTQITQRFKINHQKIRKQILDLLDHAFRQNQKMMKQQLFKQSKTDPAEFTGIKLEIQSFQQQISSFLKQLRGAQYRRAISQVVLKDFSLQIDKLRKNIVLSQRQYINNLGQVQPDISRIQCLKNDLKSLFYFKKKTAKVIQKSIFSVLAGQNQQHQSPVKYNESKYDQGQQGASRTRKSFFNFGS